MSAIKYYNTTTGTWDYLSQGPKGEKGSTGDTGPTGPQGVSGVVTSPTAPTDTTVAWLDTSVDGVAGGLPTGGLTNQVLAKGSSADFDTKWTSAATGTVSSVTATAPLTGGVITSSGTIGIDQTALTIAPSQVTGTAVVTSDSRLSDTRTPTDGSVTDAKISGTLSATKITGTAAVLNAANTWLTGTQTFLSAYFSTVVVNIKAAANQVFNLLQFQKSDGTVLAGISGNGQMWTGNGIPLTNIVGGDTTATSGDGTTATITLTTASGLSVGDMVIVQNIVPSGYNGTFILTGVSNTSPYTISYANATTGSQTGIGRVLKTSQFGTQARSAGTIPLIAKGANSQVANLQEWQNSAGNAVLNVAADGTIQSQTDVRSPQFNHASNYFSLLPINTGGMIQLKKASASSPTGTTDYARIALVAGTTAGTLKLVIQAGTSATAVTIVDNIPQ